MFFCSEAAAKQEKTKCVLLSSYSCGGRGVWVGGGGGINLLSCTCQYVYVCGGGGIQLR